MQAIILPYINPILIELGPIPIRWYSLAYVFGIFLGAIQFKYLAKKIKLEMSCDFLDDLVTGIIIGIVIGGRLGFVLIYEHTYYFAYPLEILKTWNGGMSFHGGLIGFCIATTIVCRMHKTNIFAILDISACCAPIGIFLGRIANFINNELYGRITNVSWAVVFPGENIARHPSQIYEALSEGLLLFVILNILMIRFKIYKSKGMISGLFCFLYAFFRFIIENFRQPDKQLGFIIHSITMGQILSILMIIIGTIVVIKIRFSNKA